MDIIEQIFPQTQADDSVAGQYWQEQQPWQILQSVRNGSTHDVDFWREMKKNAPPTTVNVNLEVKKK